MGFQAPTFNLTADIRRSGLLPPTPVALNTPAQLRASGRQSSGQDSTNVGWPFCWSLLVPALTDLRDQFSVTGADSVEMPAGSGRNYLVVYCDDVAKGFLNEYREAIIRKNGMWPTPMP